MTAPDHRLESRFWMSVNKEVHAQAVAESLLRIVGGRARVGCPRLDGTRDVSQRGEHSRSNLLRHASRTRVSSRGAQGQAQEETMRRVILESPYAGDVERNVAYARACLRDSLLRGEAPIASHLLYTQPGVLDDKLPEERQMGIDAGLAWGVEAEVTVVYTDHGVSRGMQYGIDRAHREERPVEYRTLDPKNNTMKSRDMMQSELRKRVLARSGNACECLGECGYLHDGGGAVDGFKRRTRCRAPGGATVVRFAYDAPDGSWIDSWDTDPDAPDDLAAAVAVDIQHRAIARVRISVSDGEVGPPRARCERCHARQKGREK